MGEGPARGGWACSGQVVLDWGWTSESELVISLPPGLLPLSLPWASLSDRLGPGSANQINPACLSSFFFFFFCHSNRKIRMERKDTLLSSWEDWDVLTGCLWCRGCTSVLVLRHCHPHFWFSSKQVTRCCVNWTLLEGKELYPLLNCEFLGKLWYWTEVKGCYISV